jgi:hypothetical protein
VDPRLAALQRELSSSVAGFSFAELTRAVPGKWSVAEILEHLYLTYTGTIKGFSRLMAENRSLATTATWKQRGRSLVVVGLGYMPGGRKAPSVALPRGLSPEKVSSEISTTLAEMDELMTRCAEKFGTRRKVLDHPILGPLSIDEWRKFHLVHGLHHVKQMRRLREKLHGGAA